MDTIALSYAHRQHDRARIPNHNPPTAWLKECEKDVYIPADRITCLRSSIFSSRPIPFFTDFIFS